MDWMLQKPQHSIVAFSLFAEDFGKEVANAVEETALVGGWRGDW
jgi:hypothetical protein